MKAQMKATDQQLAEAWFSPDATSQIAARYDMTSTSVRERWSKLKKKGLVPNEHRSAVRMNGFVPKPKPVRRDDDYDEDGESCYAVKYPKTDRLLQALRERGHDYAED